MRLWKLALLGSAAMMAVAGTTPARAEDELTERAPRLRVHYEHVLLISVDGLHAVDLQNYIDDPAHRGSTLYRLARRGVIYPNALTTAPSDSFPGMIAQVTGGTPKTAGVFYDDSYDRTLYAPGSNCAGDPGAETTYAENLDYNLNDITGGGTLGQPLTQINPANLPMQKNADGSCTVVLPHQFIRTNTIFEVIRSHGGYTAWSDKHPAYEILNGPSGQGIVDLFTPEINSAYPAAPSVDNTGSFKAVQAYDDIKVKAILNEINGLDSTGSTERPVPAIFGMNFQAVSVGQKLAKSGPTDEPGLVGGYLDAQGTPGLALARQLTFVDGEIGQMVDYLAANNLLDDTLIIISAKHGQSPIDVTLRRALSDSPYTNTPGYGFHIADDVALLWLKPQTRAENLAPALAYLQSAFTTLGIQRILTPATLTQLYNNPARDSRTPDYIAISQHGVIYTGGSKLSEHGGFARDDRNVALLVYGRGIQGGRQIETRVLTTQIAPTILSALRLDPEELRSVRVEGTQVLPGLNR